MDERALLLDDAVIRNMLPTLGRSLTSVTYAALEHEIGEARDLALSVVYIGGELILRFEGVEQPVVVTWAENAGWPDHFSIQVRRDSAFTLGALVNWLANELPPLARSHRLAVDARPSIRAKPDTSRPRARVSKWAYSSWRRLRGDLW